MNSSDSVPISTSMRLVALLLIVGGVVGIGVGVWLDIRLLTNSRISLFSGTTAIIGVFILLYGWAVWTGLDLWKGRRRALKFAQILFAMQIPLLTVPGFSYEFHIGLTVLIAILSGPHLNLNFNLGSSFAFYISSQVHGVVIGINLVALVVLVYLIRKSREISIAPLPQMPISTAESPTSTAQASDSGGQTPQV